MFNGHLKEEIKAARLELAMHKQLLHGLTEETMALTVDENFRIIEANENFLSTLGYTPKDVGRLLSEIVPSYVVNLPCYRNLRAAVEKGHSVSDNYRFLHANGSLVWVHGVWQPIRDDAGKLVNTRCFGSIGTADGPTPRYRCASHAVTHRSPAIIDLSTQGSRRSPREHVWR